MLVLSIGVIVLTALVIMYACDSFEEAADYLGRDMKPGVKGATINAIGSSLPELFTTAAMLFGPVWWPAFFGDRADGFSAGIATCAGSAVFNAVVIPGASVLAVLFIGVKVGDRRQRVDAINLRRSLVLKDGIFFILAELLLIYFLNDAVMQWWMGGALAALYIVYMVVTLRSGFGGADDDDDDEEEDEVESGWGILGLGWLLDFRQRLYGGARFTNRSAWVVLSAAIVAVMVASAGIAWAVEHSAEALGVEPYFTAVILAAAATSVPDTVLSVKDALKGNYDDAVANAVGSNIFDITVALGVPLLAYGLLVGDVNLTSTGAAADVQMLRWVLLTVTVAVLGIFLIGRGVGRVKTALLFGLYGLWTAFVVARATDVAWAARVESLFG